MDIGTILLIAAIAAGIFDALSLLLGPKLNNYERYSFITSSIGFLAAAGAFLWMGFLIFTNQFQYDYIAQVTKVDASFLLKISALWAGQSGSLVFWTFLSFSVYFGFRLVTRGYEDDKLVYRAAIIMIIEVILVAFNAFVADPFRLIEGAIPTDGLGLNPLLSTIWNVIHPPIIFIAYALILVPFSVKLAGFTLGSEERNKDPIQVVSGYVRFTTVFSWLMLSAGIAIGGYWAYIVLGWGGYWAWDPVETTSLIPWLLITAYYHAKPILSKNDVLRDSFLVMGYIAVLFATWTTRSGILNSVHGFGISIVSWTMLMTLVSTLIIGVLFTIHAGLRDMTDEDSNGQSFFKEKDVRLLSIKIAFIGLLIVAATSTIGVAYPATYNIGVAIFDPANLADSMIGIRVEFFRYGFYTGCAFLIASAFFCMKTAFLSNRVRGMIVLSLYILGGILAILSMVGGFGYLPTNYWPANFLVLPAIGAIVFLIIAIFLQMVGKDKLVSTRQFGRLMLHLGLIILLLGVFMSENVIYESNSGFVDNEVHEIAPGVYLQVTDINLQYWVDENDFNMIVTVQVIENVSGSVPVIVGIGYATITGNPGWNMVSHQVYLQSNVYRDVFIAITGFSAIGPSTFLVTIHSKILPLVSFVWFGAFLMITSMFPMFGIEGRVLLRALRGKENDLYGDIPEDSAEAIDENQGN